MSINLNNLITTHIEYNYYNGDLLGLKLIIDADTGYFNATKLCNLAGKKFIIWKELHTSKTLVNFVFSKLPNGLPVMYNNDFYRQTDTSGIYVCKELLLNIASWAYPEKYLEFNKIVISEGENNNKMVNDKLNRILLQLEKKSHTVKDTVHDKLNRILFQLEKQPKTTKF